MESWEIVAVPLSKFQTPNETFAVAPVRIAIIKLTLAVLASTPPSPNAKVSGSDTILVNIPAVNIAPRTVCF